MMDHTTAKKAPPPPSFVRKAPAVPVRAPAPAEPVRPPSPPVELPEADDGAYHVTPETPADPLPAAGEATFSDTIKSRLDTVFGADVMSSFVADKDRIGAAYVILQSVINNYVGRFKKPKITHSLTPLDLDKGINEEVIAKIVRDLAGYYRYFSENSKEFVKIKDIYSLPTPEDGLSVGDKEGLIEYLMSLFRTVNALMEREGSAENKTPTEENVPYDGRPLSDGDSDKGSMWELAEQVKQSLDERNALIDEIAIPVEKRGYPVDAHKLAANFLKESKKNPDLARELLYDNPATFAPLQVEKLPRRWFGLVKAKPQDAIAVNKELGRFLKKFVG